MSVPWTPDYTARFLSRLDDARLATITPMAFYLVPISFVIPMATATRLIEEERSRRANVARNATARLAAPVRPAAAPKSPPPIPAPIPQQASLFE